MQFGNLDIMVSLLVSVERRLETLLHLAIRSFARGAVVSM